MPGFVPSDAAYAPSVEVMQMLTDAVAAAVAAGELDAAASEPDAVRLLIAITAGVIGLQGANQPDATEGGPLLAAGLDMYRRYYAPGRRTLTSRR